MSVHQQRVRELLASEEQASRPSVFQLETHAHPLVNPNEGLNDGTAFRCYAARMTYGRGGGTLTTHTTHAPLCPASSTLVDTAGPPSVFPARLRPQFTQLEALDLLAIERRVHREEQLSVDEARLQARVARAREAAQKAEAARQPRTQRQARRKATAAGLQATKRLQEEYVTIGQLGR